MPVFPAVASMNVPPGWIAPERSAASTMDTAIRSLIDPPGFCDSSLRYTLQRPVSKPVSGTSGVFPIRLRVGDRLGAAIVIQSHCLRWQDFHHTNRSATWMLLARFAWLVMAPNAVLVGDKFAGLNSG